MKISRKTLIGAILAAILVVVFILLSVFINNGSEEGSRYYATVMALFPAIIAIVLALITKEAYSSLFIGIIAGALLHANFNPANAFTTVINDGFISSVADAWNAGILIFLVLLGAIVALVNKAGGSYAFGKWAKTHIKTAVGAQLATFALGVLIFVDDYFNCLTVGSVMRPLSDSKGVSRAKFAYLIDSTAAPICMIAPISSWAAAVAGVVVSVNGLTLFIRAIPYNFYSLLTIVTVLAVILLKFDFGPMKKYESAARNGDLYGTSIHGKTAPEETDDDIDRPERARVIDLLLPVIILIVSCIVGMIYTGGFFDGVNFIDSFADCVASLGLSLGAAFALILIIVYLLCRRVLSFKDAMACLPKGFRAMVPAILILCFAWTLNGITGLLGADVFVYDLMYGAAEGLQKLLPAIIFLAALGLSFATGTSWGTFSILIPIVTAIFPVAEGSTELPELLIIGISACLAGAVCGDHCSPISDTTIMASAGGASDHLIHVSTQLPYALTVAAVSFVSFILAGFIQNWLITLPIAIVLMLGTLFLLKILFRSAESKQTR